MDRVALVVGETLVDVVHGHDGAVREHPGGSAANAAIALARLGREVWFATAWADDEHGALLADHLRDNGVHVAGDPWVLDRTATAVASVGADGAATYAFDLEWRLGPVDAAWPEPDVVMCGSIGAVLEPGAGQVRDLVAGVRGRATTVYDVNARAALTGSGPEVVRSVEAMAALADVVKASDEDLAVLWPSCPLEVVGERLLALGPSAVVVTRGPAGAVVVSRQGRAAVPAPPTEVADTIGAGDTFGAALVDALWERGLLGADRRERLARLAEGTWEDVLAWAVGAAAVTVSRAGADPPRRTDLA